jgi:uncharacterized protein
MNMSIDDLLARYALHFQWQDAHRVTVSTRGFDGDYPIHIAAMEGNPEEIKLLLDNGADIEAKGENDFTPLHSAVEFGRVDNVKFLLKSGASIISKNTFGQTPVRLANILDYAEIKEVFEKFGEP